MGPAAASLIIALSGSSPRVSLHSEGETVATVLANLSRQSHRKLRATGEVADERIVAEFKQEPLGAVKDRLARATLAKWVSAGDAQMLVPAPERWRPKQRAEDRTRINDLKAHLAWRSKALAQQGVLDERTASGIIEGLDRLLKSRVRQGPPGMDLAYGTPVQRLLTRILKLLTPEDLKQTGDGKDAGFSNRPTKFQRRISRSVNAAFSAYEGDRTAWLAALTKHPKVYESELASAAEGDYGPFGTDTGPIPYAYDWERTGSPFKVVVNISEAYGFPGVSIELSDSKGVVIEKASEHGFQQRQPKQKAPPIESPIRLDDRTRAYIKSMSAQLDDVGPPPDPMPTVVRASFLHPETAEPLSLVGFAGIENLAARSRHERLLACLPDDLASLAAIRLNGAPKLTPSSVLDACTDQSVDARESGGWLEIGLSAPSTRINRAELGRLLRSVAASGSVRLSELAQYAAGANELAHYPYILLDVLPSRGFQYESVDWSLEWLALRILGGLTAENAQRAKEGRLPVSFLSPAIRRLITEEFLSDPSVSDVGAEEHPKFASIYEHAFEALPNGPASNASISISEDDEPAIFAGPTTLPSQASVWQENPASYVLRSWNQPSAEDSKRLLWKGTTKEFDVENPLQRQILRAISAHRP